MFLYEFDKPGKRKVTIDLDTVTRYYELSEQGEIEVYFIDGGWTELRIAYHAFDRIMRQREATIEDPAVHGY
jgi:hypothetical protein